MCSASSPETWGLCLSSGSRRHLIPPPVACGLSALDGEAGSRGECGVSRLAPRIAVAPCATCRGSLRPAAHRRELRSEGTVSLPCAWAPGRLLPDPHSACGACLSLPISSACSYGSRPFSCSAETGWLMCTVSLEGRSLSELGRCGGFAAQLPVLWWVVASYVPVDAEAQTHTSRRHLLDLPRCLSH